MNEKFYIGLALGMLGGALITANSIKARKLVKDGQTEVIEKLDAINSKSKEKNKN
jgi:hypothetical protein